MSEPNFWTVPGYAHWALGLGGFFTFGFTWLLWLVIMIVVEIHNEAESRKFHQ